MNKKLKTIENAQSLYEELYALIGRVRRDISDDKIREVVEAILRSYRNE